MRILHKMEDVLKNNSFMFSRKVSGICILQVILLGAA